MCLRFRMSTTQRYTASFPLPNNVNFFLQFGHLAFVLRCTFFSSLQDGSSQHLTILVLTLIVNLPRWAFSGC